MISFKTHPKDQNMRDLIMKSARRNRWPKKKKQPLTLRVSFMIITQGKRKQTKIYSFRTICIKNTTKKYSRRRKIIKNTMEVIENSTLRKMNLFSLHGEALERVQLSSQSRAAPSGLSTRNDYNYKDIDSIICIKMIYDSSYKINGSFFLGRFSTFVWALCLLSIIKLREHVRDSKSNDSDKDD